MTPFLKSEAGKAELIIALEQDKAVQQAQDQSPIQTPRDIRAFWVQHPKTCDLFGVIMTMWRKSRSMRPSHRGYWAAYPYRDWSGHTGLPVATLKRHLNILEQSGLIERILGRHGGNRVLTFIRPTELAFKVSKVRESDWLHLLGPQKPEKPKAVPAEVTMIATPKPKAAKATPEEMQKILFGGDD